MKLDKSTSLFFCTKIDSKLREGLALSKPGDKKYFDGSSDEFLRILEIGDDKDKERWIGKVIKGGAAVTEVDDIQRNILSILRRVAPTVRRRRRGVLQRGGPGLRRERVLLVRHVRDLRDRAPVRPAVLVLPQARRRRVLLRRQHGRPARPWRRRRDAELAVHAGARLRG